jgi:1,4-dihydroxy-2-naphthoate octaprenyltransferase
MPWLAAPMMVVLARTVVAASDARSLNWSLKGTARLLMLYGVLLAGSLL